MFEALVYIYLIGAGLVAFLFFTIHLRLRGERDFDNLHAEMMRMAPEYILLWPWRCVGYPLIMYTLIKLGLW